MDFLTYAVATVINVGLVAVVARRLLGVPVGWPRTLLVSLAMSGAAGGLLNWTGRVLNLDLRAPGDQVIAAGLIFTLVVGWVIAAEVGILAVLEAFVPTGSLPGPLAFIRSLPARRRRGARYTKIVAIAASHGLGAYLRPTSRGLDEPASKVARSLREALIDGGVTFVKLGQMLSSRPDLLPEAYIAELSLLQSDVPPQPWSRVKEVLEADLSRRTEDVFAHIDEMPVAAASVAQVHLATLHSGAAVVVKIQRPDARRQTVGDLDIVLRLASWLDRATDWGRRLGVRDLAIGFAASLEEELDYRIELANMRAVGDALARSGPARLRVPRAHEELSSARVLVMDRLPGRSVSQSTRVLDGLDEQERRVMAHDLLGAILHQIIVTGVFHADLHPGNIFIADDGTLGLLDFGAVGRLDQQARTSIGLLLAAVDRQDSIAATDALLDVLDRGEALDDRRLEREIGQLILRHTSGPSATGTAAMFIDLFRMVMRHGLAVPPQVAAAFRALGALEGSLRVISPGLDLIAAAREQGQGLVKEFVSPTEARARIEGHLATLLPTLQRLPRRVNKITEDLEAGRFTVNVRGLSHPDDRAFITGIVHQVVMTLIAAACALGGIVLVVADAGPMMTTTVRLYAFIGFTLLFFGFILAARVLVLVFHQHNASWQSRPRPR